MEPSLRITIFFPDAEMPPTVVAASIFRCSFQRTRNVNRIGGIRVRQECVRTCALTSKSKPRKCVHKFIFYTCRLDNGPPRKISSLFWQSVIFARRSPDWKWIYFEKNLLTRRRLRSRTIKCVLTHLAISAITSSCAPKEQSTSRKYHLGYTTNNNFGESGSYEGYSIVLEKFYLRSYIILIKIISSY